MVVPKQIRWFYAVDGYLSMLAVDVQSEILAISFQNLERPVIRCFQGRLDGVIAKENMAAVLKFLVDE